jgi:hypothetical protein
MHNLLAEGVSANPSHTIQNIPSRLDYDYYEIAHDHRQRQPLDPRSANQI